MYENCMKIKKPTCDLYFETRHEKMSGKYPVKIRVTFMRKQYYFKTGLDFTKEDYHYMHNPSLIPKTSTRSYVKKLEKDKLECNTKLIEATAIIEQMVLFDKTTFKMKFEGMIKPAHTLKEYYEKEIENKKRSGSIGTASSYLSSLKSLLTFRPKLTFLEINPEFLRQYESWLITNGKSITTVGIYLRPLRAIIIQAIEDLNYPKESYPFGRRRYQIPTGKNIKKALSKEEISLLFNYNSSSSVWHQKARDFFIFSYLANGMNMKDILQLQGANIDGEFIRFRRAKTQGTIRSGTKPITVPINKEMKNIIERWGNKNPKPNEYIFSVLEKGITPELVRSRVQQFTKMVNKYIKEIAITLGIQKPVTTYFARHSYATILRKSGVSTEFICEALGHSNITTTANYLDSFDDDTKKEMHHILTQFISNGQN